MIVATHQPNYLPYLGFFDKMVHSDVFVILDDVQANLRDFQHRNKIRTSKGWQWLTVPVEKRVCPINEVLIKNGDDWQSAHYTAIHANYLKTPFYSAYEHELRKIYQTPYKKLHELNMDLIYFTIKAFNIRTEMILSSDLGTNAQSTERLVEIVEALGGDTYLSGSGGRNYVDISLFEKAGIKVKFQDFEHPIYKQHYNSFIPNMAAIDALFNTGEMP